MCLLTTVAVGGGGRFRLTEKRSKYMGKAFDYFRWPDLVADCFDCCSTWPGSWLDMTLGQNYQKMCRKVYEYDMYAKRPHFRHACIRMSALRICAGLSIDVIYACSLLKPSCWERRFSVSREKEVRQNQIGSIVFGYPTVNKCYCIWFRRIQRCIP